MSLSQLAKATIILNIVFYHYISTTTTITITIIIILTTNHDNNTIQNLILKICVNFWRLFSCLHGVCIVPLLLIFDFALV